MHLSDYISVFSNILKNFSSLKSDFIGIKFDVGIFTHFIINILIAILFVVIYYKIGKKIRLYFFRSNNYKNLNNFIDVALGYIFVNSGLGLLGLFSLLYPVILWIYIGLVVIVAFYPFHEQKNPKNKIVINKWVFFGVLLFVIIAFLRLIPPEIGEDAIGYHTSDAHLFLKNHTTVILSVAPPYVIPAPHLGEMSYMLTEFIGFKDSSRYVHFSFYFLVVLLLLSINSYAALFFVTAPVVIQISSKANLDFQWILCWLLSILVLTQNKVEKKNLVLTGILFGGVLASKLWTMAFFPLFILYLLICYKKLTLKNKIINIVLFSLSALLIDIAWLLRSFIISGNPIFPVLSNITTLDGANESLAVGQIVGFNSLMFHMKNISVFSPLFYLGIVILLLHWRYALKLLRKLNLSVFFSFLAVEYLSIRYHFGRYLLGLYSLAVLVISLGISDVVAKYKLYKIIFIMVFGTLFVYYFTNTLLILPYGFGWADNNRYLTRVLSRDNSSYYDFDHLFNKWISNKDKVATYRIYGYYYANFDYVDINYIFNKDNKSLSLLLQKGVTKLMLRGGDIAWFCRKLRISNCNGNIKLLASYTKEVGEFYLYSLESNSNFSSTRYIR